MITQDRLAEVFVYDDGKLIWKIRKSNRCKIGDISGSTYSDWGKKKRRRVYVDGKSYQMARLIFLFHHGWLPETVDHIDRDPTNDRIENLRAATRRQQNANKDKWANTSSAFKGVSWNKQYSKWQARIKLESKHKHLGYFADPQQAANAYDAAALEIFGTFAVINK